MHKTQNVVLCFSCRVIVNMTETMFSIAIIDGNNFILNTNSGGNILSQRSKKIRFN